MLLPFILYWLTVLVGWEPKYILGVLNTTGPTVPLIPPLIGLGPNSHLVPSPPADEPDSVVSDVDISWILCKDLKS